MSVKVNITVKQKSIKLPTGTRLLIRKACNAILNYEGFNDNAEVDVSIVNDDMIKEMNREFRNIDASTDVLSFPLGENGNYDKINVLLESCILSNAREFIVKMGTNKKIYGEFAERDSIKLSSGNIADSILLKLAVRPEFIENYAKTMSSFTFKPFTNNNLDREVKGKSIYNLANCEIENMTIEFYDSSWNESNFESKIKTMKPNQVFVGGNYYKKITNKAQLSTY